MNSKGDSRHRNGLTCLCVRQSFMSQFCNHGEMYCGQVGQEGTSKQPARLAEQIMTIDDDQDKRCTNTVDRPGCQQLCEAIFERRVGMVSNDSSTYPNRAPAEFGLDECIYPNQNFFSLPQRSQRKNGVQPVSLQRIWPHSFCAPKPKLAGSLLIAVLLFPFSVLSAFSVVNIPVSNVDIAHRFFTRLADISAVSCSLISFAYQATGAIDEKTKANPSRAVRSGSTNSLDTDTRATCTADPSSCGVSCKDAGEFLPRAGRRQRS